MLRKMAKDKVTLIKDDENRIDNIQALVHSNTIIIPDPSIPIEENDTIIRILPNGLEESYIVTDRGFIAGTGGIKPHYQVKVRKIQKSHQSLSREPVDPSKVFVVHGRNLPARDALFQFLRSISLNPIEWSQAVKLTGKAAPFVGEILGIAFSQAQAVVVLLTGDDEAKLMDELLQANDPGYEREFTPQARPNVLFEAGMAFGCHPDRTLLIELGQLRPFSDIAGRHTIKLDNSTEKRQEIAQRLISAGCSVDLSGTDWHKVGDFEGKKK